jgi:TIR domain
MSGNIFINYRRGDDPGFTQALYSRLEQAFPPERLFMDVDDIAPGLDFVQVLNDQVARCDVLVAVIGKNWLLATDEDGVRRLDHPEDFVRIEIESALAQKKRVIPVLVNDARMPRSTELPDSLKAFARCNAVRLTHERFRADMQGLVKSLEGLLTEADKRRREEQEEEEGKRGERQKVEAERLTREKTQEHERVQKLRDDTRKRTPVDASPGLVGWLAELPSEISWFVPLGTVVVYLLGWVVPGLVFTAEFGFGLTSLCYGVAALLAVVMWVYLRRDRIGGGELAVCWFAAVSFFALVALSLITLAGYGGVINSDAYSLTPALITLAVLVVIRRAQIGGLEASVYWLGIAIIAFWAVLPLLAAKTAIAELDATYFAGNGYRMAALTLAAVMALSALLVLLWRWWKAKPSMPEVAVYLLGVAFAFITAIRLV